MLRGLLALLGAIAIIFSPTSPVFAFCGFYVAQADAKLFNRASQVVIARDGNRTILTMANDYQGELKDFALVVPVPVVLKQEQVRIGDQNIINRLDAFSAPRLVEYFDENPCDAVVLRAVPAPSSAALESAVANQGNAARLGVTIEEKFSVGEYDILILSAKESDGLETWLTQNGYRIPAGARSLLQPYIRQQMKFFVAKVNLKEFSRSGAQSLRPLMMAFESPKFMLPIRLGMVNANGTQDVIVYLLTPRGQVEVANYRTVKVPSNVTIPVYVKTEFGRFAQAMFQTAYEREGRNVAFLEYAWDMSNCDPCSAEPLTPEELRQAGVFWLDGDRPTHSLAPSRRPVRQPPTSRAYITRLHVRYTRDRFPEDLIFKQTNNNELFQGRYVLQHPFRGTATCEAAKAYQRSLPKRLEREAQTLANLTNWDITTIRRRMNLSSLDAIPFWRRLWR
ncbi:MAG: DUF2330 domain-containing protein [Oscillatoriales cyanobacterium SM2_2_1]|nr:DUF2330 domain-containing protein [Oscillatoriales cyanobacterium SM2_2_1]